MTMNPCRHKKQTVAGVLVAVCLFSCTPLVSTFDDVETASIYDHGSGTSPRGDGLARIATYNVRFGMELRPWFADACGSRVLMTADEAQHGTSAIIEGLKEIDADIVMLQEVDISSKRSNYIEQMNAFMKGAGYRYGAYASNWKVQIIPSDGLGRVDEGNAILSRYPIVSATRYALPLREDLDALTKYFYVRECVLAVVVDIPGTRNLVVLNVHVSAFATDDTKLRQVQAVLDLTRSYKSQGNLVVLGGDFNLLPPFADSLDYCIEDMCPGQVYHSESSDPYHLEGSNYAPEIEWMQPFFDEFAPAIPEDQYVQQPQLYFTHAVDVSKPFDRLIDHMFTTGKWQDGSSEALNTGPWRVRSDHAPVVANLDLEEES